MPTEQIASIRDEIRPPRTGRQRTLAQKPADASIGDIFAMPGSGKGFGRPPTGTFALYRRMRNDPTGALARMIALGPIKGAEWSVEAEDGAPADAQQQIEDDVVSRRETLVDEAVRAVEYGFQAWELIWTVDGMRYRLDKPKPLLPDKTQVLLDAFGNYAGLDNNGTILLPIESLWYANDKECDGWYGRSRYENYREMVWQPWKDVQAQQGIYLTRAACPILMVHYPKGGKSKNSQGVEEDNFEIAKRLTAQVAQAKHVCIPNELVEYGKEMLDRGAAFDEVRAWLFDYLEVKGSHGADFTKSLSYYDALKFRAWLLPERTGLEGQYGTKAEAGVHGTIALMGADQTQREMLRYINRYVVDRILELNWGPDAKGTVKVTANPIDDVLKTMHAAIVEKVLGENANILEARIDTEVMYEKFGLPVLDEERAALDLPGPDDLRREAELAAAAATGRGGNGQAE